jgi:hypothetical protein
MDANDSESSLERYAVDETTLSEPTELATFETANDLAWQPDTGDIIAVAGRVSETGPGVYLVNADDGDVRRLDGITTACGIDWLDARRLVVATGNCGSQPPLSVRDINSTARQPIDDHGDEFEIKPP